MKKSFYTIGSVVILLIAAIVFVLLPAMLGRNERDKLPPFGTYDDKSVRYEQESDFMNYLSVYSDIIKQQGREIGQNDYYGIFRSAFSKAICKLAYIDEVERSGYVVPQEAINRKLIPQFSENGVYSSKLYKKTPASKIAQMQNEARKSLEMKRYTDDLFGSSSVVNDTFGVVNYYTEGFFDQESVGKDALYGLKVSSKETETLQAIGKDKRAFSMASFDTAGYPDSEKVEYGKANAQKFVKYNMSVITCDDKSKAQSVAKRISNGEVNFDDAVGEYSVKVYGNDKGSLSGDSYQYQIEKIIKSADDLAAVIALAKDEISKPVETNRGWSVFRCDGEPAEPDFALDATVRDVYNYLTSYESGRIEDYFVERAKEFAARAAESSFEKACGEFSVEDTQVAAFPLNFAGESVAAQIDSAVPFLAGAASNEAFMRAAFSLALGEISQPVVHSTGWSGSTRSMKTVIVMQYTGDETDEFPPEASALKDETSGYDKVALNNAVMNSPKMEDNFDSVFWKLFED